MNDLPTPHAATRHVGPLGSTIHVLRADAGTVAELAAVDWNRHFRRVWLDPVRGLIALMSPSFPHDDLAEVCSDIVDIAASTLRRTSKALRSTRLRRRGDPPGTGVEPDCAFYVGERAERFLAVLKENYAAAEPFIEHTSPDLVVEVEITSADEAKVERYAELGVRELWRLRGRRDSREVEIDFLALTPDRPPRVLDASEVLDGLTPADVCEAVEPVRRSRNRTERTEAVARIVRRRRQTTVRVREQDPPPYAASRSPGGEQDARDALSESAGQGGLYSGGRFPAAGALAPTGGVSAMNDLPAPPATTRHVGPLGSTIHVLRADAGTVAELAAVDWNRHFRRVCLDPVRGLIALMSPSHLHEDLARIFDDIVDIAADTLRRASSDVRSTRLRRRDEPPGTGMEPDCAFYVGERADRFRVALMEGQAAADAFLLHTAPDLVVEVEITSVDGGKIERYGQMGVRELWRLRGRRDSREIEVDFLALAPDGPPRVLAASEVLDGLTPADVCEAVEPVRRSRNRTERTEAVARIVRRRRQTTARVREQDSPPYVASAPHRRDAPAAD